MVWSRQLPPQLTESDVGEAERLKPAAWRSGKGGDEGGVGAAPSGDEVVAGDGGVAAGGAADDVVEVGGVGGGLTFWA